MDIIKELTDFIAKHVGVQGTAIILLAIVLIYVWFQHHRHKLLEEKMALIEQRREIAASELERLSHSLRQPTPVSTPVPGGPAPILIVDDEEMLREILSLTLRGAEFSQVATANDGQQALDFLQHQSPRLLVLDLMMPRVSGYDVLRELARHKDRFPILVFSGYARTKEEVAAHGQISPDRIEFLQKPATSEQILGTIKSLIAKHETAKKESQKPSAS